MEAKDTVMSDHDLKWKLNNGDYHIDDLKRGAVAQAEITWALAFKVGRQEMLREVVEWLDGFEVEERGYSGVTPAMAKYIKFEAITEIRQALQSQLAPPPGEEG